jgi:hypothetical protein
MHLFRWENMPNRARYYTEDKSELSADVPFIKKNNYPKKIHIKSKNAHTLFSPI